MKIAYSVFSNQIKDHFLKELKRHGWGKRALTEDVYSLVAANMLANERPERSKWKDQTAYGKYRNTYTRLAVDFLWGFRKVTHYFLAPGVADFCVASVKECSDEYAKALPVCAPVQAPRHKEARFIGELNEIGDPIASNYPNGGEGLIQGGFVIHFPAKEKQDSVLVVPGHKIPLDTCVDDLESQYVVMDHYFAARDGRSIISAIYRKSGDPTKYREYSPELGRNSPEWLRKLIYGFSLYIDAFPDAVQTATAEDVHRVKNYDGTRNVVRRNALIDEEDRCSVSPHWRRGHFRMLSSEKFIHKKGMVVYVRGVFVKGKALDVLDDAKAETAELKGE